MNQEVKLAIGIPTLNRWDLLKPALEMYLIDFPTTSIYVWDNGNQPCNVISDRIIYVREKYAMPFDNGNIGVGAAWNRLLMAMFKEGINHGMLLNDDVYLGRREFEVLNVLTNFPRAFYRSMEDFSAFIMPKTTFYRVKGSCNRLNMPPGVGFDYGFDEGFKAYYEDNDFLHRMKIYLGVTAMQETWLSPRVHRNSMTLEKDPGIKKFYEAGKKRYQDKWGGLPGKETFDQPFGQ